MCSLALLGVRDGFEAKSYYVLNVAEGVGPQYRYPWLHRNDDLWLVAATGDCHSKSNLFKTICPQVLLKRSLFSKKRPL